MPVTLRARRKDADRERIYRTALALIHAKGYEATTLRDITAEAGVALGTFFNHFPSKEHLLVHFYLQLQAEVASQMGRPRKTFRAFLKAFTALLVAQVKAHPRIYAAIGHQMMVSGALVEAEQAACGDMLRRMVEAVARGVASGELRPEVDPEAAASLVMLAFNGAIFDTLPDLDPAAFEARVHHYVDQLVRLMQA